MRSPYGFIKTAGRGSAYCTKGGHFWIIKSGSGWNLIRMGQPSEGIERATLGVFKTMTEAYTYYRNEVAA